MCETRCWGRSWFEHLKIIEPSKVKTDYSNHNNWQPSSHLWHNTADDRVNWLKHEVLEKRIRFWYKHIQKYILQHLTYTKQYAYTSPQHKAFFISCTCIFQQQPSNYFQRRSHILQISFILKLQEDKSPFYQKNITGFVGFFIWTEMFYHLNEKRSFYVWCENMTAGLMKPYKSEFVNILQSDFSLFSLISNKLTFKRCRTFTRYQRWIGVHVRSSLPLDSDACLNNK